MVTSKFSIKQRYALVLIFSVLVNGAIAAAYFYMSWSVYAADAYRQAAETKISGLQQERAGLREAKTVLEEKQADLGRINKFFVNGGQPVDFIEYLESLQSRTKTSAAIDIQDSARGSGELVLRLTVEGNEKSLSKYISALELVPYGVSVGDISFQKLSGSDVGIGGKGVAAPVARVTMVIKVKESAN